jgi:hypothetical protein
MHKERMPANSKYQQLILGILRSESVATSRELQEAIGKSQATVSRLVAGMSEHILTLGRARATLYAAPQSIRGLPAQQPIWLTDERGAARRVGTLSFLANDWLHVEADFGTFTTRDSLPWPLASLRVQGFLGRLLAQRLSGSGLGSDPQQWRLDSILFGALQLHDAPGALTIGEIQSTQPHPRLTRHPRDDLDAIAADVAHALPAGSSAGGEQPKFLAIRERDSQHVLVKFTPPRGTPFGDRWHDLLVCEELAGKVLGKHGIAAAAASIVESDKRTYLVSERFDRIGATGRRHVVSIGDAHAAFVPGAFNGWSHAAEALGRQRRLDGRDVAHAALLQQFGRLIGNSDMHSGNLGLVVDFQPKPRFVLAPVYDMLPMRWRPDATLGGAPDYAPFEPGAVAASSAAAPIAHAFWVQVATDERASKKLRSLAREMARRLPPPGRASREPSRTTPRRPAS